MPEKLPTDAAERKLASTGLGSNFVVEAGAGTGKTTLLIDRLTVLLLGARIPLQRIVALTFTDKAAGEIRARLAQRLHAVLEGEDLPILAEARRLAASGLETRAREALAALDRAQIDTIHGFASHLLRLYPLEAGVDPGFQVDSGSEREELFESEWDRWLDAELAEASPRADAWLKVFERAELEELEELAWTLCEEKLRGGPGSAAAAAGGLRALAKEARRLSEANAVKAKLRKVEAALLGAAERFEDLARHLEDPKAPRGEALSGSLDAGTQPAGWEKDDFDRAKALCRLAGSASREGEALIAEAVELLLPFAAAFRRAYERRGWVSFDGLLVRARDLVRNSRKVREELKAAFEAILIDEFQDTDPLQGELLLYLAEAPGNYELDWKKLKLEAGKLFVVGDPKQSIYRFRGADIAAFEGFTGLMRAQGAQACRLSVNFRSRPGILAAVNGVFPALMKAQPGCQSAYAPLEAHKEPGPGAEVELLRLLGPEDLSSEALREAEAEALAAWVDARVKGGGRLGEVAVLFRTFSALPSYLAAFRRKGLAFLVEGERYFYRSQEVLDFFNLLEAVDDPENKLALLGVLRSPLVGLSDGQILELKAAEGLDYRKDAHGAAGRVYRLLRGLHEQLGRRPVGELVAEVLAAPYFLELAAIGYHGEQTAANLLKFSRLAAEASDERGLSLKEFIRRLRAYTKKLKEEGESPLAEESVDAVRFLSIHKSKGLEFPVVALPNLCGQLKGGDDAPYRLDWATGLAGVRLGEHAGAALTLLEDGERRRQAEEEVRVLYVAMTRAKEKLLLLASGEPQRGSNAALLEKAGPLETSKAWACATVEYRAPDPRLRSEEAAPAVPDFSDLAARWKAREDGRLAAGLPLFISPSAHSGPHEPKRLDPDEPLAAPPALLGQVCHKALEGLDFASPKLDLGPVVAELRSLAPLADWTSVRSEAEKLLSGFLKSGAAQDLARAEVLARELPLLHAEGPQIVRGAADLLCRLDGKLCVVDFKTDQVSAKDAAARAESYRPQGERYREAVRRALGETPSFRVVFLRAGLSIEL